MHTLNGKSKGGTLMVGSDIWRTSLSSVTLQSRYAQWEMFIQISVCVGRRPASNMTDETRSKYAESGGVPLTEKMPRHP